MLWHPCLLQICDFQRFRTPSRPLNPPRLSTISNSPAAARSYEPPLKIPSPRGAWGAGDRKSRGVGDVRQVAGSRPVCLLLSPTADLGCAVRGEGVPPSQLLDVWGLDPGGPGSQPRAHPCAEDSIKPFLSPGSRREAPNPTWRVKKAEPGAKHVPPAAPLDSTCSSAPASPLSASLSPASPKSQQVFIPPHSYGETAAPKTDREQHPGARSRAAPRPEIRCFTWYRG